jgi:hypothetical protein
LLTIIYRETFITVYDDSQQQAFRMMRGVDTNLADLRTL